MNEALLDTERVRRVSEGNLLEDPEAAAHNAVLRSGGADAAQPAALVGGTLLRGVDPAAPASAAAPSSTAAVPPSQKLSVCRKLSFAIGGIPNPITSIVTTFYLSPFLLEVARVRPASVGIIVLVGRVLDAFTDPLVGALSDHTTSRYGRRRPWLLFSIIPFAITFAACFLTWELAELDLSANATV